MSASCRDIESLLSPYLDGELDEASARRVEAHLASCAACRETLVVWRESERALAELAPVRSDVEWERLARRVEDAIEAEDDAAAGSAVPAGRAAAAGRGARHGWLWGGSGALVAAALILLFWPWVIPRPGEPPATLTNGTRGASAPAEDSAASREEDSAPPEAEATPEAAAITGRGGGAPEAPAEAASPAPAPPLDVRRVAIAQEQMSGPAAGLAPRSAEARKSAPAEEVPPPFPARAPEGAATSLADLERRFTVLQLAAPAAPGSGSTPAPSFAPGRSGDAPRAESKMVRGDAPSPAPTPAVRPTSVLAWADERREAGDLPGASAAYALLTGSFPGNEVRADAWLALLRIDVTAAIGDPDETPRLDAAAMAEAFLQTFAADPRRTEVLALRARLWSALASTDPIRWCSRARVAHGEWSRAAPIEAAAELPILTRICGE